MRIFRYPVAFAEKCGYFAICIKVGLDRCWELVLSFRDQIGIRITTDDEISAKLPQDGRSIIKTAWSMLIPFKKSFHTFIFCSGLRFLGLFP